MTLNLEEIKKHIKGDMPVGSDTKMALVLEVEKLRKDNTSWLVSGLFLGYVFGIIVGAGVLS